MRRRAALSASVLLAILCTLLGCSRQQRGAAEAARPDLEPLPTLDLSGADAGARQQMEEQRTAVEALTASADAPPAELAEAYADLGRIYLTYEFLAAAEPCFVNARRLAPGDFRWHYLLGYLETLRGDLPSAIPLLQQTVELAPDFFPAVVRLGRSELDQGRVEAARQWFERALELDPGAAAAHEGLGKAASAAGDDSAAIAHFARALELDPAATGVYYALAQAHRNLGQLDEARANLEKSGDVAARVVDPLVNPLGGLAESAQFYRVQGAEAMDDGDFAAASGAYRAALERDPQSFIAYRGLAVSLERLGDLEGANATLLTALEQATTGDAERDRRERAAVRRTLGGYAARLGRDDLAAEDYLRSLELVPEQPDVLLLAANALARQGRFAAAVEQYDRLIALAPEWAPAVLEKRGAALVNLGRRDAALADFRQAIEAAPGDPRLRLRLAAALEHFGDPAGAAAERAAAAELAGDAAGRVPLLVDEARRLMRAGDFAAAVASWREAVALAPDDVDLRFELGSVLGHLSRFDDAAAELEEVIVRAPRHLPARQSQIVALILGERYGEARIKLREALREFPRDAGLALTQVRLLATTPDPGVRDGALALEIVRRVAAESQDPVVRQAEALALAAAGRPYEAAEIQRQLVAEAEASGADPAVIAARRARLTAFQAGGSWTARSPQEILAAD